MQPYLFDNTRETESIEFQAYYGLISKLKHRFQTYGYKQVRTSTFENYDLYHSVSGTVKRENMVKVIDQSGEVLVMRPDVTIPITRMNALSLQAETRLFYVLNVFRQYQEAAELKERLQAGIEHFGNGTPETDAEVMALAIHALKDLGFKDFKVEIGHAGFLKVVMKQLDLNPNQKDHLTTIIQSKNLAEIQPYLSELNIPNDTREILQAIPLLYGDPQNVLKQVLRLPLTSAMQDKIQYLSTLYTLLEIYDVTDSVVFDLGLINNMDYYSDVIFQGFVAGYGKPIMMGGRYDQLAEQFGTALPAVGFAFEIDRLLKALKQNNAHIDHTSSKTDMVIFYSQSQQNSALKYASCIRNAGYSVITHLGEKHEGPADSSSTTAYFYQTGNQFYSKETIQRFTSASELLSLLKIAIGDE
ncbi:Histidine--tRNA ligase [Lentibacillus sp. JNUCC-1]|uniref:ATP phosphoribosyltransferase regulatory subunit n=1 Tax=Lentibacillus sp. JNUCC-1 TaxID=2654513 RepID=UPI0012E7DE8B|nr:ATP phosphoribosyltransferase regulatory subunit [Lentibacillus sp. JNUCC-1]MUV38622.1 Histidine--tRNA ligase [Lentibacillus sp. JNUCC-1]